MASFPGSNSSGPLGTLNGLFKELYASDKKKLIPDGKILINAIKFIERQKQPGAGYNQPVVLN